MAGPAKEFVLWRGKAWLGQVFPVVLMYIEIVGIEQDFFFQKLKIIKSLRVNE
jgi:hypothetical protein